MGTRQAAAELEPLDVPADRLYRLGPEAYRGMVAHGLLTAADGAELRDGLLVLRAADGEPADRLYRMPLDTYERLAELGLLGPADRVALLDGLLVTKMGRNPPHVVSTHLVWQALGRVVPPGWFVKKEGPIGLPAGPAGRDSEPEPDLSVVRGAVRDYATRHPRPADMALVVEVADSSLREDRQALARYAWAEIPVAWVVNLNDRTVEVYTHPSGPTLPARYRTMTAYGAADAVPVTVDGRVVGHVAAREVLP